GNRGSVVVLYIMAALVGILVSYMASGKRMDVGKASTTLIVRKVEGLWRLPFGGGVFEALCEGVGQCWRGLCRRCCCCCRCCSDRGQASSEETETPNFSNRKTYGHTAVATAAGEETRLILPPGVGDIEKPRRLRRPHRGSSNGPPGGRSSSVSSRGTAKDASDRYDNGEVSRPRARSDSDRSSGGYGDGSAAENGYAPPPGSPSAAAHLVSGEADRSSGVSGARITAYGSAGGGGGAREVAPGQEQRRSATATKKRRGGGFQILATSAVDAVAAAAKLAEEIAKDNGDDGGK
ncbi:unnamed protein product, partial [Hapterophycus canaliculatus]